jgi:DNA-binding MarR family transcriptional regulator
MPELLDTCARELMDTAPQIMRSIRVEMRRGRGSDLSIPQFRTLGFIQRNADSTLSNLADHLGLTLPSVSKLVDGLVKQELVIRQEAANDRRCLALVLTPAGESIVNSARAAAQANLAKTLGSLSADELEAVRRSMELLRPLFAPPGAQGTQGRQSTAKDQV